MAAQQIIKGDDLMLFYNSKSLAYATAHTLTITGEATDTSSKDHGMWAGNKVNKINWEITSENLYTETDFNTLFTAMTNGTKIQVVFGLCGSHTEEEELMYDHHVDASKVNYSGYVYITNLTANANTGENATYSVTLTGTGKLTQVAGS